MAEVRFPIGTKFWGLSLLALCFILFFWQLGAIPFYERGEPREGLVVWEMHKTGNWILPIINGDYIPFKPPFFHWIGALISAVIGEVNELTIRLPSALFATLGVVLVYIAGTRLWNEKTGRLAAVVLATTPGWWRAATMAQVDMTLAFFMTAALLLFYFMYREGRYARGYSMAVGSLLACATLAKGPVGLLVPLLTVCVFLWLRRDFTCSEKSPPYFWGRPFSFGRLLLVRVGYTTGRIRFLYSANPRGKSWHCRRRLRASPALLLLCSDVLSEPGALELFLPCASFFSVSSAPRVI